MHVIDTRIAFLILLDLDLILKYFTYKWAIQWVTVMVNPIESLITK